jgi:hypothetical protein
MSLTEDKKILVQDQSIEEPNPNYDIYSDTTTHLTSNIKSWCKFMKFSRKRNPLFLMMQARGKMF